jgi:hypothetical protein
MLLWYEKCIEIPESGLNETVGWHLLKAHLEEDLPELMSNFVEWMKCTGVLVSPKGLEIVRFESSSFPGTPKRPLIPITAWVFDYETYDASISAVKSVSSFTISKAHFGPFEIL